MTFAELKAELSERLQDTSTAHQTRCGEWLNMAYQDIAGRHLWTWLQETDTFPTVADTPNYTIASVIASDVDKIFSIRYDTTPLYLTGISPWKQDYDNPDNDLVTGIPRGYSIWDGVLYLTPCPDDAYTLLVKYYKLITELSADGDEPLIPVKHHDVLLRGGEYYGLMYNDDERANAVKGEYERGIQRMRGNDSPVADMRIFLEPFSSPTESYGPRLPPHRF